MQKGARQFSRKREKWWLATDSHHGRRSEMEGIRNYFSTDDDRKLFLMMT
jgi:hypothetical protein